jgi:Flp pilus assembly protein TadD
VLLAWSLLDARAGPQADAVLRQAQQRHPNDLWINHDLGSLLHHHARPPQLDDAVRFFNVAVALRPDSPGAYINFGGALHDRGRLDEAVAAFRKAAELQPDLAMAHYNLGITLRARGRSQEAAAAFRRVIALQPDNAQAYNNLGNALRAQGHIDEVLAVFRKAVALKPDYAEAHNNLGNALQARGRLDEAVAAYQKALALKPDYATAHCNLGMVLQQKGEFRASLAALRRGHELGAKQPGWHLPSAEWVRQAEVMARLEARLPALLQGEAQPANDAERVALARYCRDHKRLYAKAAQFWEQAFAKQPALAEDLGSGNLYDAASAAALAGCGEGADAGRIDERERARLRGLALSWLRADLALWGREEQMATPEGCAAAAKQMKAWQDDPELAGLRDAAALAKLPAAEQEACRKFWAEVAALRARTGK